MRYDTRWSVLAAVAFAAACGGGATEQPDAGCPGAQVLCGAQCVDVERDREHCGGCDTACADGEVCSAGVCALSCQAGLEQCGDTCVDTDESRAHCGGCDAPCADGEVCSAGACAVSCQAGLEQCGDTCVDTDESRAHCGGCDTACADGEVCSAGVCALSCQADLLACEGTCVDPQRDERYCGATGACVDGDAGVACADGERCDQGVCVPTCGAGLLACDGGCVDPLTDPTYCGATACGDDLTDGEVCASDVEACHEGTCFPLDLPPQCAAYTELDDATRHVDVVDQIVECDYNLPPGWYRFVGEAGTQLPEAPPVILSCGTHAPGWLNGSHPSLEDGTVERQVCFSWGGDTCQWSTQIQVTACLGYYVYNLVPAPVCSLRYCGSDPA